MRMLHNYLCAPQISSVQISCPLICLRHGQGNCQADLYTFPSLKEVFTWGIEVKALTQPWNQHRGRSSAGYRRKAVALERRCQRQAGGIIFKAIKLEHKILTKNNITLQIQNTNLLIGKQILTPTPPAVSL